MTREIQLLYLEDAEFDCFFFEKALRRLHFQGGFQRVCDGEQGLRYLLGYGSYADRTRYPLPSLIVTDLNMPTMDGLAFLRQLRARYEFAHIPVVILSVSGLPQDRMSGLQAGADRYLIKPHRATEWDHTVREILACAADALLSRLHPEKAFPAGKSLGCRRAMHPTLKR